MARHLWRREGLMRDVGIIDAGITVLLLRRGFMTRIHSLLHFDLHSEPTPFR